jgi:hypothetical protein
LREDLLLDVSIRPNLRDLERHALVHQFCVKVLTLDLLAVVHVPGKQLDRVWIGEVMLDVLRFLLKVDLLLCNVFINDSCRKVLLHGLLKTGVALLPIECEGVASDYKNLEVLHMRGVPDVFLVVYKVVANIKLLQEREILLSGEQLKVETRKLVPAEVESLKFGDLTQDFH